MNEIQKEIKAHIDQARRIAILCHERPDGDALGSALGLCWILRAQGKEATVLLPESTPPRLAFLVKGEEVQQVQPGAAQPHDLVVIVDTAVVKRQGGLGRAMFTQVPFINIDHHGSNEKFGDVNWIEADASSTGEMIWQLAEMQGWPVPDEALPAIYTALVTDTGRFSFSNTSASTLEIAAKLVRRGVDPYLIWQHVFCDRTQNEFALEARARSSLQVWANGQIATIYCTHKDFVETETSPISTSQFPDIPRMLKGVKIALYAYEIENGARTNISIRAQPPLDATILASQFGGGGHKVASGCSILKPAEEAVLLLRDAAMKLL